MLNRVNWGEYLRVILVLVTAYYIAVSYLNFFPRLKKYLSNRIPWARIGYKPDISHISIPDISSNIPVQGTKEEIELAHSLSSLLMETIYRARENKYPRQELVFALQGLMGRYVRLADTDFRKAIDYLVKHQCERVCSICLKEEELKMMWTGRAGGAIL
jgi:hypothetical protein